MPKITTCSLIYFSYITVNKASLYSDCCEGGLEYSTLKGAIFQRRSNAICEKKWLLVRCQLVLSRHVKFCFFLASVADPWHRIRGSKLWLMDPASEPAFFVNYLQVANKIYFLNKFYYIWKCIYVIFQRKKVTKQRTSDLGIRNRDAQKPTDPDPDLQHCF